MKLRFSQPRRWLACVALLAATFLLPACRADLRTSVMRHETDPTASAARGAAILDRAWRAQGMDRLSTHRTYSFVGLDTWRSFMGKMGKPWPDPVSRMAFQYQVGTFDSRLTFLDGKRSGTTAGLQSWNYYEAEHGQPATFQKTNVKIRFGLSAYQYFFELVDRLRKAPIIRDAGQRTFEGVIYDQVFVTWGRERAHATDDQYLVWVNHATGVAEFAQYTLRKNYLPGAGMFHGSIRFMDFRAVDGILIPHEQRVYLSGPPRKADGYLHRMVVEDFRWDAFPVQQLHPDASIQAVGDSKAVGGKAD